MKSPDKIYIGEKQVQPNGFCGLAWKDGDDMLEPVEYIRKDYLMERLARAKELRERHSSNPNTLREYIAPIEALMDIINSL